MIIVIVIEDIYVHRLQGGKFCYGFEVVNMIRGDINVYILPAISSLNQQRHDSAVFYQVGTPVNTNPKTERMFACMLEIGVQYLRSMLGERAVHHDIPSPGRW